MAKKKPATAKATSASEPTDRRQYLVNCSAEESEIFERISAVEGDRTVQQWLLRLARVRVRKVQAAEEAGTLDQL